MIKALEQISCALVWQKAVLVYWHILIYLLDRVMGRRFKLKLQSEELYTRGRLVIGFQLTKEGDFHS